MVGQLMREACAFFMRRSFGADKLYSATFKEYVSKLVTEGESSLEFYIEGTRSRTAKSLMPKFGEQIRDAYWIELNWKLSLNGSSTAR